jgi:hypothetical protein
MDWTMTGQSPPIMTLPILTGTLFRRETGTPMLDMGFKDLELRAFGVR